MIYDKKLDRTPKLRRDCFDFLFSKMQVQNISLVGLRQVGKSTLTEQLILEYYDKNIKDKTTRFDDIFYIKLKAFSKLERSEIHQTLHMALHENDYKIVAIDEVQLMSDWSDIVQSLVDLNKKVKFVFTGSSASNLIKQIAVNRYSIYFINPLSFNEYTKLWNDDSFDNYLSFGSYPPDERYADAQLQYLEQIKQSVIDKIIYEDSFVKVDEDNFYKSFKGIKNYIGNEINKRDISLSTGITRNTISDYISLMLSSRLVQNITNILDHNQLQKNKLFLNDKSMINHLNNFELLNSNEYGSLIENLVFNYLDNKYNPQFHDKNVYFYKNNVEIDFIVPNAKLLIEVKYRTTNVDLRELIASLESNLVDEYKNFEKIIITKDREEIVSGWRLIPLQKWIAKF